MAIFPKCVEFLSINATSEWYESYKLLQNDSEYVHRLQQNMLILRVEKNKRRAFYWLYNINDALKFVQFVGKSFCGEAHEVIVSSKIRFFFDIDMLLDDFEKEEISEFYNLQINQYNEDLVMNTIGEKLAVVFKNTLLISLEENGISLDSDLSGFDYLFTMRNRETDNGYKISIHIITNLVLSLNECKAISKHIIKEVIPRNIKVLEINQTIADCMKDSIDHMQYRNHGSLSLPYSTKEYHNKIISNQIFKYYDIPKQYFFITVSDEFVIQNIDTSGYQINNIKQYKDYDVNLDFINMALKHVHNIPDYNSNIWDIKASVLKGSTMYVKRFAPSWCSVCERVHDNDNTLFLIFNSEKNIASWKCAHKFKDRAKIFYQPKFTFDRGHVELSDGAHSVSDNLPKSEYVRAYSFDINTKTRNTPLNIEDGDFTTSTDCSLLFGIDHLNDNKKSNSNLQVIDTFNTVQKKQVKQSRGIIFDFDESNLLSIAKNSNYAPLLN